MSYVLIRQLIGENKFKRNIYLQFTHLKNNNYYVLIFKSI